MRITGQGGRLRHGYQTAALLGAWTLTREGGTTTVTAHVAESDSYWLEQRPMDLRLLVKSRVWAWSAVTLTPQQDGSLSLTMHGAPQVM